MEVDMDIMINGLRECKCLFFLVNRKKYERLSSERRESLVKVVTLIMTVYMEDSVNDASSDHVVKDLKDVVDAVFFGETTDAY
jgi:hypothetical protein